ncbi:hypothetical protein [Actinoallomurus sp. CA-142502]|uniref:hypothetical protein n=1 Tax=Actinoallomurus sp. CA-142502 TaxID=3239885 RepID=UPI003D8AEEE4
MSGRLVGEVHAWLRTPAAEGLNVSQRMVLSAIAERANDRNREMWSHTLDGCTQFEYLMEVTGLKKSALSAALNGLAERELETRIVVGYTKASAPVFAHRGRAMKFILPVLPASVALPRPSDDDPSGPVDNPGDGAVENAPAEDESLRGTGTFDDGSLRGTGPIGPKASGQPDPMREKASGEPDPNPSKENPSKEHPSPPMDPTDPPEEEDATPAAAPPTTRTSDPNSWDPTYPEASEYLSALPNDGQEYMDAAGKELGTNTPVTLRVVHAARAAYRAQKGNAA